MPQLDGLKFAALASGEAPTVFKDASVVASAFPKELAHIDAWIRCDARHPREKSRQPRPGGWKVHVSAAVEDVGKAWDALMPLLVAERLKFKAANAAILDRLSDPEHKQAGKTLVIYANGSERARYPTFWEGLLPLVEERLAAAGTRPGWAVRGDRPVRGSSYLFVRCDRDALGGYTSAVDGFNPFGVSSPFDGVSIRRGAKAAEPVGEKAERIARLLDFVAPGWEIIEDGVTWMGDTEAEASALEKALVCAGIAARRRGEALTVRNPIETVVAANWHEAMEIRRAAEIGTLVREASGRADATVRVRSRRSDSMAPIVRIGFRDPAQAVAAAKGLYRLRGTGTVADGPDVVVPYAGSLHQYDSEATCRALQGLACSVAESFSEISPKAKVDEEMEAAAPAL